MSEKVERILTELPEDWDKLKRHMETTVLPAVKTGKALTQESVKPLKKVADDCQHLADLAESKNS